MKVIIGLETHVQLNTKSKLFCGCKNPIHLSGNEKPNTLTCPTCLGLPGSKPRLNEVVVQKGILVGLALECTIAKEMWFSRKTYFYPDMGKNFQITQYEVPLGLKGKLQVEKRIRIRRVHIEEDPSRLVHGDHEVLCDYNRSGIPLLEIVTEPDFSSPKEARIYLQKLELILEYLGVYSPDSRAVIKSDANISLNGGNRVEVKNITGTKEIEKALSYEILRQSTMIKRGQKVERGTRMWNPLVGVTQGMRGKEGEAEYGYITEPDLTSIEISKKSRERVRKGMPELPDQKYARFHKKYRLSAKVAESLVSDLGLALAFEEVANKVDPRVAGNWLSGVVKKTLNYNNVSFHESDLKSPWLAYLLDLFLKERITDRNTELTVRKMVEQKRHPKEIIKEYKYEAKRFDIDIILRKILKGNDKATQDFRKGEKKALHFLIGLGMKETKGNVDANTIRDKLVELLKK